MKYSMFKNSQKGFTLIELLVVIAIIGILAAMVITNVQTARQKARDASAITSLSAARAEAEIYYDGNGLSYGGGAGIGANVTGGVPGTMNAANTLGGICNIPPEPFGRLLVAAHNANLQTSVCKALDQSYTAYIPLVTGTPPTFCIDSTGFAGRIATVPANPGVSCQ